MSLGICGGDIKRLSAATLVKAFYDFELNNGSIIKGAITKKSKYLILILPCLYKQTSQEKHFLKEKIQKTNCIQILLISVRILRISLFGESAVEWKSL